MGFIALLFQMIRCSFVTLAPCLFLSQVALVRRQCIEEYPYHVSHEVMLWSHTVPYMAIPKMARSWFTIVDALASILSVHAPSGVLVCPGL